MQIQETDSASLDMHAKAMIAQFSESEHHMRLHFAPEDRSLCEVTGAIRSKGKQSSP